MNALQDLIGIQPEENNEKNQNAQNPLDNIFNAVLAEEGIVSE